jgi:general secretion pathway protein G
MTLIEIMVVVAIIGLVMGGVTVVAFQQFKRAQLKQAKSDVINLKHAIEQWKLDNPEPCPKALADLVAGKYLSKPPKDPWGKEYLYACPGQSADGFDIASAGPDGKPGSDDDIKE